MANKTIIYADGGSRNNPGPSALGVVITDDKGKILKEYSRYLGEATNNQAEYAVPATIPGRALSEWLLPMIKERF